MQGSGGWKVSKAGIGMRWGWRGGQEPCHVGSGRLWFEGCILFDFNPDVTNPSFSVNELTWPLRRDREPPRWGGYCPAGPDSLPFPSTVFHRTASFRAGAFSLWEELPSKALVSHKTGSHWREISIGLASLAACCTFNILCPACGLQAATLVPLSVPMPVRIFFPH